MDLNYLYRRHQLSLMRADAAASLEARLAHAGLARGYARRIEEARALRPGRGPAPLAAG